MEPVLLALSIPPILPPAQTLDHRIVHLVELPVGIPRPEIVPPAAKHGRRFRDNQYRRRTPIFRSVIPTTYRPSRYAREASLHSSPDRGRGPREPGIRSSARPAP